MATKRAEAAAKTTTPRSLPQPSPPPLPPPSPATRSTITSSLYGQRLPDVERLSGCVVCVRALNPGFFTGPGTNTYIVGTGRRRVLIDAGDAGVDAYISLLRRTLHSMCDSATISHILVTHSHPDHVGGVRAAAAATSGGHAPALCRKAEVDDFVAVAVVRRSQTHSQLL